MLDHILVYISIAEILEIAFSARQIGIFSYSIVEIIRAGENCIQRRFALQQKLCSGQEHLAVVE